MEWTADDTRDTGTRCDGKSRGDPIPFDRVPLGTTGVGQGSLRTLQTATRKRHSCGEESFFLSDSLLRGVLFFFFDSTLSTRTFCGERRQTGRSESSLSG